MKHFFSLPALLRTSLLLASVSASPTTFSVNDDLRAFPQFEVKFTESYLSELDARSKVDSNDQINLNAQRSEGDGLHEPPPSQVQHYVGTSGDDKSKDGPRLEYEYMNLESQRYLCSIPLIDPPSPNSAQNDTLTKAEEERELVRANERGWELISGMQGNCVYFISGWWSYRFCYGDGVKQFHQLPPSRGVPPYPPVEDPSVEGFVLGSYKGIKEGAKQQQIDDDDTGSKETAGWDVESALDVSEGVRAKHRKSDGNGELVQRGESRYLVQRLEGGTTCDLTGKPRRVDVQFHCNPQSSDRISLIKETSTCAYLLVIQTPRLCNDVAFLPPQKDHPHAISCSPVLAEDEVEDYERDLKALRSAEREAKLWEANAEAAATLTGSSADYDMTSIQIVGDIVVGGRAFIPDGVKIEKSAIVGGGKETYIDTVASSDGKILSEEDMKRLGLGDPRAVEKLKKELEKIAQGQEWKLDVIDTPRGREYRGIIGDEDEDDKGGDKKKETGKKAKPPKAKETGKGGDEKGQEGSEEEYYKEEL